MHTKQLTAAFLEVRLGMHVCTPKIIIQNVAGTSNISFGACARVLVHAEDGPQGAHAMCEIGLYHFVNFF